MQENLTDEIVKSRKYVRGAFVAVLVMLAMFLLSETISVTQGLWNANTPASNVITVSGEGKSGSVPDMATVSYTIKKKASSVASAQSVVTKIENEALGFLKKQGIADTDIQTTSYRINPNYEYRPCANGICPPSKVLGYYVSQSISVKIHNLAIVGKVLGGLGSVGVTNVSGPSFSVNDLTSVKAEARGEAIAKAKAQAKTLAKQLGVRLVRITRYTESNTPSYPVFRTLQAGTEMNTPNIPAGRSEYTVKVHITYEIR